MADTKRKNRFGSGNGGDISAAIRQNTEAQSRAALQNGTLPVWKGSSPSKGGTSTTAGKGNTLPGATAFQPKEKDERGFWEKLLGYLGDAGYSADTTLPTAPTNQAIMDDYRASGFSESKTAEASGNIAKAAYAGAKGAYYNAIGTLGNKRAGTQIMGVTVADDAVPQADKDKAEAARKRYQENVYAKADKAAAD